MRHLTEKSLTNAALFYLRRFAASEAQLKRVLERKAKRAAKDKGEEPPLAVVQQVVQRMARNGYVDDARLATTRTASLRRGGRSTRMIRLKLRQKGLAPSLIEEATRCPDDDEEAAARTWAKKKKLGAFGLASTRKERRPKDLAVLARAGFSFAIARKVVDGD